MIVSFDMFNLFTNVPTYRLIELFENLLSNTEWSGGEVVQIENVFRPIFYSKIYSQQGGLAMDSPLSLLLAEMDVFEAQLNFNEKNSGYLSSVHFWFRHVDNLLIL